MKTPKPILNVSYRVLDASGHCVEIIKETGTNRNLIQWLVERKVEKKYGKSYKIHQLKVVKET
jgi:hypothetical protein